MPKKDTTYERIERALYKDRDEAEQMLTVREQEIRERMILCVAKKMDSPLVEDSELVNFLMHGCGGNATPVSQSQAYRDISMINRLVGNIQLAAKNWYRYMIVEGAKKAISLRLTAETPKVPPLTWTRSESTPWRTRKITGSTSKE